MPRPSSARERIHTLLIQQRRTIAARTPKHFTEVYLRGTCSHTFSSMHEELFDELDALITNRNGRLAVAAPRGHAKSTIVCLAFVLWCILYEKEHLILIVSATKDQAIALLRHVRDELMGNEMLRMDFPDLCPQEDGSKSRKKPSPWRQDKFRLANECMVMACGVSQGIRGLRNGKHRPGLIIADDLEDPLLVVSEDQRAKLSKWFTSTLLHAGHSDTNVVVVGTILHHESLLANLTDSAHPTGWKRHRYRAVRAFSEHPELWERWTEILLKQDSYKDLRGNDGAQAYFEANEDEMLEGTDVLWPEHESYHDLMLMRLREGEASFQAEKQNEPRDPEQCIFSRENIHYWDDEYDDHAKLLQRVPGRLKYYCACDPGLVSRTGKGDFCAIVMLAKDTKTGISYVIMADIARRKPDEAIEFLLECARVLKPDFIGIETNNFQKLMADNLKERALNRNIPLRLHEIQNRTNKLSRIAALEPLIAQGFLQFSRRHTMLLDQLLAFPLATHDDGPDALEMAVATSRDGRVLGGATQI